MTLPPAVYFNSDFTIEAWIYPRNKGDFARIIDFGNGAGAYNVWLGYEGGSGRIALEVFNPNGTRLTAPNPLTLNQWTHVAATVSGTTATLYYNGVPVISGTMQQPANVLRMSNYIGKSNWGFDAYLNAYLSDIRIWNYARTQAQIDAEKNHPLPGPLPGLIANWRLDQSGTEATDASGQGQNGILQNNAHFIAATRPPGFFDQSDTDADGTGNACDGDDDNDGTPDSLDCQPQNPLIHLFATEICDNIDNNCNGFIDEGVNGTVNKALLFDGANDKVFVGTNSVFNSDFVTVEAWTKPTSAQQWRAIMSKRNCCTGSDFQWSLQTDPLKMSFGAFGTLGGGIAVDPNDLPTNTWVHYAGTYDGDSVRLYRNGVLVKSVKGGGPLIQTPYPVMFGSRDFNADFWPGIIDEVRIWNVARTGDDIKNNMNVALTQAPGLIGYWDFNEGSGSVAHDRTGVSTDGALGTGNQMPQWVNSDICLSSPPGTNPVNALNDKITVPSSIQTTLSVLSNDQHANGFPLKIVGITQPAQGSAQIAAGQTAVTYQSAHLYSGADTLQYFVSDTLGNRDTALVIINVTAPQPDLLVSSILVPPNANSGQAFQVRWVIKNMGAVGTNAPEWFDRVWLSPDTVLETNHDVLLGSFSNFSYLLPNESYSNQANFTLANGIEGNYYIFVQTDATSLLSESNEANNARRATLPIILTPSADLRVEQIIVPDSAFSGGQIQVTCTVKNRGNGVSNVSNWFDQVYFNKDSLLNFNFINAPNTIRLNDIKLGSNEHIGALQKDSSYTFTASVQLPSYISGKHYVKIYTDINPGPDNKAFEGGNVIENSAEFNNTASVPVLIKLAPHADLEIASVSAAAQVSPAETVSIDWRTINNGFDATSTTGWPDGIYISPEATFNPQTATFIRDYNKGVSLEAGQYYDQTQQSVKIPQNIVGQHYLYVVADRTNAVFEGSLDTNNVRKSNTINVLTLDLLPENLDIPAVASSGLPFHVGYSLKNQGQGTIYTPWSDRLFVSIDSVFNPGTATLIGTFSRTASLAAGADFAFQETLTMPNGLAGNYYVFLETDSGNNVFETESQPNNLLRSVGTVAVSLTPWADLQIQSHDIPATLTAGNKVLTQWQVKNFGLATASASWTDKVWISSNNTLDANDVLLASVTHTQALLPGAVYTELGYLQLPVNYSGTYFLLFKTDAANTVYEHLADDNNNILAVEVTLLPYPPVDLTGSAVALPQSAQSGQNITVSWLVTNTGNAKTLGNTWRDIIWFSTDDSLDVNDLYMAEVVHYGVLEPGANYTGNKTFNLPNGLVGEYYLIVKANANNQLSEADYTNNIAISPEKINIALAPLVDLQVSTFNTASSVNAGQPVMLQWTVGNMGIGTTPQQTWYDFIFLSNDQTLSPDDLSLGSKLHSGALIGGGSYMANYEVEIPVYLSGNKFLILSADNTNLVYEHNAENNNTKNTALQITVAPPCDLIVTDITFPPNAITGDQITIQYTLKNQGINAANGYITDALYFSSDTILTVEDALFATNRHLANLAPGETVQLAVTAQVPGVLPGSYRLFGKTNIKNNVKESDLGNNGWGTEDSISIDLPTLQLGVVENTALTSGQTKLYKLSIGADLDLRLTLTGQTGNSNELYTSFGKIPSLSDYEFGGNEPFSTNQQFIVPTTKEGTYYVLVVGREVSGAQEDISILAEGLPFMISGIKPNKGGKGGKVSSEITGARFTANTIFYLKNQTGDLIPGILDFINSTKVKVKWDLLNSNLGIYDLIAKRSQTDSVILSNSFTVLELAGFEVQPDFIIPEQIRTNQSVSITARFTNTGNINIPYLTLGVVLQDNVSVLNINDSDRAIRIDSYDSLKLGENGKFNYVATDGSNSSVGIIPIIFRDVYPDETISLTITFNSIKEALFPGSIIVKFETENTFIFNQLLNIEEKRNGILQDDSFQNDILKSLANNRENFQTHLLSELFKEKIIDSIDYLSLKFRYNIDSLLEIRSNPNSERGLPEFNLGSSIYQEFIDFAPWIGLSITMHTIALNFASAYEENSCQGWVGAVCNSTGSLVCQFAIPSIGVASGPALVGWLLAGFICGKAFDWGCDKVSDWWCKPIVKSYDPNDIVGPPSYSDDRYWVARSATLPYTIRFENDSALASAPAQVVNVTQKLDPHIDARTFRLGSFGFGQFVFQVPDNQAFYAKRLDLRDSLGIYVDVLAGIDVQTSTAFWTLKSIDPATGLQPNNPLLGFLAINDTLGAGQGFVSYTVRPATTSVTGDTIFAKAKIVFDINDPIETPQIFNTIDAGAPISQIGPLPLNSELPSFVLDWSGTDDAGGSGIRHYDIYVSENNGAFQIWAEDTTATTGIFKGVSGSKYTFFSTATDHVGNQEPLKTSGDWSIVIGPEKTLSLLEPSGSSPICADDSLLIRWTATNIQAFNLDINSLNGDSIFQALNLNDTVYLWPVPGNLSGEIILAVSDSTSGSLITRDTVFVFPVPSAVIMQQGDSLIVSNAQNYQWFFNGMEISTAANDQVYYPQETGNYSVMVTDSSGCTAVSEDFFVDILGATLPKNVQVFRLAPNPAKTTLQLTLVLQQPEKITLLLHDAQQRLAQTVNLSGSSILHTFDVHDLPAGMYYLTVRLESGVYVRKVVKAQ
ncbi:MAG: CARDB domain-containing protein [Saprospiraceae bacterium]